MVVKRNIVTCILLSIVTCGIYGIIWFISLTDDVRAVSGDARLSGGKAFLFTLITCGIYGLYWYYKMGENVDAINANRGNASSNSGILYLVIGLFGLGIVNYCLMQDAINKSVA